MDGDVTTASLTDDDDIDEAGDAPSVPAGGLAAVEAAGEAGRGGGGQSAVGENPVRCRRHQYLPPPPLVVGERITGDGTGEGGRHPRRHRH